MAKKLPWAYLILVFVISLPFWLLGAVYPDALRNVIGVNLPTSALMVFNPMIAAAILTAREKGWPGVKSLLKRTGDFRRIAHKRWYLPMIGLLPLIFALAYGLMRWRRAALPADPEISLVLLPVFFLIYFVTGVGEELGWSGYAYYQMKGRWNALQIGLILGIVGAIWHVLPDIQAGHGANWILWQRLYSIGLRVLTIWLFNNTGESVFAAIVFHASDNVAYSLFPNNGSHFDPFYTFMVTAVAVLMVVLLWGYKTLARFRFGRQPDQRENTPA